MSARDDAPRTHSQLHTSLWTAVLALLAGAAVGLVLALLAAPSDRPLFEARVAWSGPLPSEREWPRLPRAGESVRIESTRGASALVIAAPRAPRARELAGELLARHTAGVRQLYATGDALLARWRESATYGPPCPHEIAGEALPAPAGGTSPAAACAALLQARALACRGVLAAVPPPWRAATTGPAPDAPPQVVASLAAIASATESRDVPALRRALVAGARLEDEWFAAGVPTADASLARRAAVWASWQRAGADSLAALSQLALADATPEERLAADMAARAALADLALRLPRPYDALIRSVAPADAPAATPIGARWARWLGTGALLGGAVALLAALAGLVLRRARRPAAAWFVPSQDPASGAAWLHVVVGETPVAVARAVIELSAHVLARGERVLVVDGGPRLKLHERFGREARWGLMECLLADMPVIGLVQYGGRPGFYLLAHGNAARGEGWAVLGQRLDDARPHFGRIVLALDAQAPRAVGDALAGRAMQGWWAEATERLPKIAIALSDRLGIGLCGIDLAVVPEVSLEVMAGRARALALVAAAPATAVAAATQSPEPAPAPVVSVEPIVLDCDLQVRQRLRFLAWMRRVQSERGRLPAERVSESLQTTQ